MASAVWTLMAVWNVSFSCCLVLHVAMPTISDIASLYSVFVRFTKPV